MLVAIQGSLLRVIRWRGRHDRGSVMNQKSRVWGGIAAKRGWAGNEKFTFVG